MLDRRQVLVGGAALATMGLPSAASAQTAATAGTGPIFFTPAQFRWIERAVDRLIPGELEFPGARETNVATYIDRQLAGPFGAGDRFFLGGPHKVGLPTQGYQLPYTPAQLYQRSLAALEPQPAWSAVLNDEPAAADQALKTLETGDVDLDGVSSAVFFETLLTNTVEGYFGDPAYGGNANMASWRMIGFPGAYAAYLGIYTRHGIAFTRPPVSMADGGHAHHPHSHR